MQPSGVEIPVLVLPDRPAWHDRAACIGQVDLFFRGSPHAAEQTAVICAACPVRVDCFDYAMADPELVGFWAGTTARDRQHLWREAA